MIDLRLVFAERDMNVSVASVPRKGDYVEIDAVKYVVAEVTWRDAWGVPMRSLYPELLLRGAYE